MIYFCLDENIKLKYNSFFSSILFNIYCDWEDEYIIKLKSVFSIRSFSKKHKDTK